MSKSFFYKIEKRDLHDLALMKYNIFFINYKRTQKFVLKIRNIKFLQLKPKVSLNKINLK